jgi:diguanylate cyclase (GGDEF)-like protein
LPVCCRGAPPINYVLARDARWAAEIDKRLGEQASPPPRLLDKDLQVLDAAKLNANVASPSGASLPTNSTFNTDGFSLIEGLDRLTMGWALSHIYRTHNEFVSKLDGFAVLASLQTMLGESGGGAALAQSVNDNAVETVAIPGDAHNRLALVPMTDDGKVARVYAFAVDQTAAAALTNVALTVVTLTTSLLIVLGFSVPAAIASRRIRERWLAEDQIRYLAMHDSLTGLPNRLQLHQHLDRAVARGKRHGHLMAVFGLDLDCFKDVNDTLGHPTGDALLAEGAARLKESTREVDLVGRGGDEFAIVAEDLDAPEDAMQLARRICTALGEPYHVNGHEVTSSASIGIGPLDREPPDTLLKHADSRSTGRKRTGATPTASSSRRWMPPFRSGGALRTICATRCARISFISTISPSSIWADRLRGAGALVASFGRRDSADDLPSDRRGDRPDRTARRMDPQDRLCLRDHLAARHHACRQPLARPVQDPGCARAGAQGVERDGS